MAPSAVWRGSRLVYGSWNTICTSRPRRRRSAADRAGRDRSRPQAVIDPAVGRSSPTIIRAIVVLPDPDSPTMAIEPASATRNDTSSTATRSPNSLRSEVTSRTGVTARSALAGADGQASPRSSRARTHRDRPPSSSVISGSPARQSSWRAAPGRERALVGRRLERGQRAAGDGQQPVGRLRDVGAGRRERRGVRVQRVVVQPGRRADLHDLPGVHHRGAVADGGGELQVVRDEHHGQAELAPQVVEDGHDLGLGGDVERRGRLVGQQQPRLGEQRGGDHDPLQHPAGQLVRVLPQPPRRRRRCRPG